MEAYQQVIAAWNAQADETNQWDSLGEDEKIEWALKCADQFRGATKMMAQELVACMTKDIDPAILDELDRSGGDGLGLQKTPSGWWGMPKGKLTPVHYGSLREALIAALGIESNA